MPYIINYYPKAELEYLEAYAWYKECLDGLEKRFEFCVESRIKTIADNPLLYPNKKFDSRECKVADFPYLIVYKFYPKEQLILIVSIFHTSRSPKKKYRK